MTDIPAIPVNVQLPSVESEPLAGDFEEQFVTIAQEDLPQGVIALLQQLLPRDLPIGMSGFKSIPKLIQMPTLVSAPGIATDVEQDFSTPVKAVASQATALRLQDRSPVSLPTLTDAKVALEPVAPARRDAKVALEPVVPARHDAKVASDPVTGVVTSAQLSASVGGEPRKVSMTEAGDKLAQPFVLPPAINSGARVATPATPDKPASLMTRLPPAAAEATGKAEQVYLRLPFAKDSAVGHVSVSKATPDVAAQLQLTGSSAEVTRHLSQHLASAEPGWRLTDGQNSGQQQGGGSRQQSEDGNDDVQEHAGHEQWQG